MEKSDFTVRLLHPDYYCDNVAGCICYQITLQSSDSEQGSKRLLTPQKKLNQIKSWLDLKTETVSTQLCLSNKIGLLLCHSNIELRLRLRLS